MPVRRRGSQAATDQQESAAPEIAIGNHRTAVGWLQVKFNKI